MVIEEEISDTDIGYVQRRKRRFEHHIEQVLQRSLEQEVSVHVRVVSSANARLTRVPFSSLLDSVVSRKTLTTRGAAPMVQ